MLRKVKIINSQTRECAIILTDAPDTAIKKHIDGLDAKHVDDWDFSNLAEDWYMMVLYKSGGCDEENITKAIEYDSCHDLGQKIKTGFQPGRMILLRQLRLFLKSAGHAVSENSDGSIIVENTGKGPNFLINVMERPEDE